MRSTAKNRKKVKNAEYCKLWREKQNHDDFKAREASRVRKYRVPVKDMSASDREKYRERSRKSMAELRARRKKDALVSAGVKSIKPTALVVKMPFRRNTAQKRDSRQVSNLKSRLAARDREVADLKRKIWQLEKEKNLLRLSDRLHLQMESTNADVDLPAIIVIE